MRRTTTASTESSAFREFNAPCPHGGTSNKTSVLVAKRLWQSIGAPALFSQRDSLAFQNSSVNLVASFLVAFLFSDSVTVDV